MQESAPDIQITHAAHKQPGRGRVDQNADCGDAHYHRGINRFGRPQAQNRFPGQRPDGHQQQTGIDEAGKNGATPPAIGVARAGRQLACAIGRPGQQQPAHVAEFVAGIGQQGQRIRFPAIADFEQNEADIERNTHNKRRAVIGGPTRMGMVVIVGCAWMHVT